MFILYSFCVLGDRILSSQNYKNCTKDPNVDDGLFKVYCHVDNNATIGDPVWKCDDYFETHEARLVQAIPGLSSGVFWGKRFYWTLLT